MKEDLLCFQYESLPLTDKWYINGRVVSLPLTNMRYINDWVESVVLHQYGWRIFLLKDGVHEENRLFVHDNRMFAEHAFYCIQKKFLADILNMTYSCRVWLDMIGMECKKL